MNSIGNDDDPLRGGLGKKAVSLLQEGNAFSLGAALLCRPTGIC